MKAILSTLCTSEDSLLRENELLKCNNEKLQDTIDRLELCYEQSLRLLQSAAKVELIPFALKMYSIVNLSFSIQLNRSSLHHWQKTCYSREASLNSIQKQLSHERREKQMLWKLANMYLTTVHTYADRLNQVQEERIGLSQLFWNQHTSVSSNRKEDNLVRNGELKRLSIMLKLVFVRKDISALQNDLREPSINGLHF